MTWAQLQDEIEVMTPEELKRPIYFIEDTLDGSKGLAVEVNFGRADFYKTYGEGKHAFTIYKGEGYLWR